MPVELAEELETRHSREAIEAEIQRFEERVQQLRSGAITEEEFRPFRLKHGTYGQRQPGFQMLRVKIVAGILKPGQLRVLAEIADDYSTGRGHVTTRENMQFHFVKLDSVTSVMRMLADVGLTTREACGNTVRNVTACPLSGICPGESFDVTPYALGVSRYLLRHPDFHDLPRKFKIAFSGCEEDGNCAISGIHDIGLIAQVRGSNGTGKRGFKVLVGGGLGSLPTEAAVLFDFLPEEELLPTIEAILRVFNETGNRKNKFKARLKFVLREKGVEEFRRLVADKRKISQASTGVFSLPSAIQPSLVTISATPLSSSSSAETSSEYGRWAEHNLMSQRQTGYAAVWIKLPAGTLHSPQMRGLADLLERQDLTGVRIAVNQDLVVPWVPLDRVRAVYEGLKALDLATPGARTIADVTGCPGATTCNLGITRSLTLADVLARELADLSEDPEILKLRIKISGCPNSCGHHHIADIGFYGNVRKIGNQQAPYYQLLLGGRVDVHGVHFGRQIMSVPARTIPGLIRELLTFYKQDRQPAETFSAWVTRTPDKSISGRLNRLTDVSDVPQDFLIDWGDTETYSLKLGRGECAA